MATAGLRRKATDHSLLYTSWSPRTIPHRMRVRGLLRFVDSLELPERPADADLGCSNGGSTQRIADRTQAACADAYDAVPEQLEEGRERHPELNFQPVNLNQPTPQLSGRYDFVTCLETVEHVGVPEMAVKNTLDAVKPGGVALITVPIETGLIGVGKFLIKGCMGVVLRQKSYFTTELDPDPKTWFRYLGPLVAGRDISLYRGQRTSWGTHFGFDYRLVERVLDEIGVPYQRFKIGSTMFYSATPR